MKKAATVILLLIMFAGLTGLTQEQTTNAMEKNKSKMLGLRTCAYVVPDLNSAKEWYSKAFGIKPYFDEPFYVGFNVGGYELGLMPEEKEIKQRGETVLVYWGVENVAEVYEHLIKIGAENHEEPHGVGGPLEVASVLDPWGNAIGIIYNPEFKIEE